jgi:MerR family transcriptional regulator, light-induced transcriptional regulator
MSQRGENDSGESHREKISELARAYAAALLAGDEVAAEMVIREAMDADVSTPQIDDEMITPALWLVGELWERGEISIAEEHIATEITLRVLALQREAQRVARARSEHKVMLATPVGELHVVALRMAANLLRGAGYEIVMLGADVPEDALSVTARRIEADVVCMSSTLLGRTEHLMSCIDRVRRECRTVGFVIGGRGVTIEAKLRPEIQVCHRVSEVVEAVDALVKRARLN